MNVALHHELVAPPDSPHAWLLMTHGIFGSGGNWRSIARKLVERRPHWGVVLVDLRGHGRSPAGEPPHTVEACARDLRALDEALYADGKPVKAACGHSFGGKVVLALRALTKHPGVTARPLDLLQTWVLDSTPAARPEALTDSQNDALQLLALMESLPPRLGHREELINAVTAAGHSNALGQWLAMNLESSPDGGYRLRLDLPTVRSVLTDYFHVDLWDAVERTDMPGELHLVAAGRSHSVSHDDRVRLAAHQAKTGITYLHLVPEAGHWLHMDAPDAVVELLAGALPNL